MAVYVDNARIPYGRMLRAHRYSKLSLSERFWMKVDRRGPDECWPWLAGKNGKKGYGRFSIQAGQVAYAHRVAFNLSNDVPLSDDEKARHSCDNPPCCNPAHLLRGSTADNARDMVERGRCNPAVGERHRSAKLTEHDVLEVLGSSESNTDLAQRLGVGQNTIGNIRRRVTWRHVIPVRN